MSEAFTKAKCFRDSDYITAKAQRTFGDHITARLQLVPEIDSRAKMPIARPQTRTPRRPVNTMKGDTHDAQLKDAQEEHCSTQIDGASKAIRWERWSSHFSPSSERGQLRPAGANPAVWVNSIPGKCEFDLHLRRSSAQTCELICRVFRNGK
jgi:hypothetical protein